MFKQKYIAIIDVGSEDIAVYIGSFDKARSFHVKASAECAYDGFQDSDWLNKELLKEHVCTAINKALYGIDCKISSIYVGVPGEFTKVQLCDSSTSFGTLHKVTSVDVDRLYEDNDSVGDDEYSSINYSTIFYSIDGKKRTVDPIGMSVRTLSLKSSYILCRNDFIADFNEILSTYSKVIKFISTPWAECISLFNSDIRDQGAVLVDVGYITTDVSYIVGDGLCGLGSVSLGGGHMIYDLSFGLNIPYNTARYVKTNVDFALPDNKALTISVVTDEGEQLVEASYVNMIAESRVDEICEKIAAVIDNFGIECPSYLKVYLTGGGMADMRGITSIVAKNLDRVCELKIANLPVCKGSAFMSSVAGLIQVVSNHDKSRASMLASLFRK